MNHFTTSSLHTKKVKAAKNKHQQMEKKFPCIRCNSNLTLEPRRLYRFFKESDRSFKRADCFVSAICLPWRILCSTSGFSSLRILYKCYNKNVIPSNFFFILCSSLDTYIIHKSQFYYFSFVFKDTVVKEKKINLCICI